MEIRSHAKVCPEMVNSDTKRAIVRGRFKCIGNRLCDGDNDSDMGHVIQCSAAYRYRAMCVIEDYEKMAKRSRVGKR